MDVAEVSNGALVLVIINLPLARWWWVLLPITAWQYG